jgi:hypothetical protein
MAARLPWTRRRQFLGEVFMVCTRTMSGWCRARSQRSKLIEKGESTVRWHQWLQAAAPVIVGGDDEVLELVEVRGGEPGANK